jgi:hypothetical protein
LSLKKKAKGNFKKEIVILDFRGFNRGAFYSFLVNFVSDFEEILRPWYFTYNFFFVLKLFLAPMIKNYKTFSFNYVSIRNMIFQKERIKIKIIK